MKRENTWNKRSSNQVRKQVRLDFIVSVLNVLHAEVSSIIPGWRTDHGFAILYLT